MLIYFILDNRCVDQELVLRSREETVAESSLGFTSGSLNRTETSAWERVKVVSNCVVELHGE
jgi:hypothetical protein